MRLEADGRIVLWPFHLARLQAGCTVVGFDLPLSRIEDAMAHLPKGRPLRLRLAVGSGGDVRVEQTPLPPTVAFWRISISDHHLCSHDPWLGIKSSHRPVYDAARAALPAGVNEVLLLNERDEVCEGTITSLFLQCDSGLVTPPLSCGVLPGVLRASLLASGKVREKVLSLKDLSQGRIFMGNALRGMIPASFGDP